MANVKTTTDSYECNRPGCGHMWTPRILPRHCTKPPRICPKCKSKYWDSPTKLLFFSVGSWDFTARALHSPFPKSIGECVTVKTIEDVYEYPNTSATIVVFTGNWYVENSKSTIPAALIESGYRCLGEHDLIKLEVPK